MRRPADGAGASAVVVGLGYIGLPTAVVLATHGFHVTGVDVDRARAAQVDRGILPFVEPELGAVLEEAVAAGALRAGTEVPAGAEVYVLAVPTPVRDDRTADLSHVDAATDAIAPQLRGGALVVLESTSPPGTTERVARRIRHRRPDLALRPGERGALIDVAYCPERVLPGRIMAELRDNDRVVGGLTPRAAERARDVYRTFCTGEVRLTDARTAELVKLVENAFRDVNIAFANEIAAVCERLGADVWEVVDLANRHPRVDVLRPGPGVGGHCIAVDPWFLVGAAPEHTALIRTAREVNLARPPHVARQVVTTARRLGARRVAVLGLSFKPDVDDVRESPAVEVIERLLREAPDLEIVAVEPHARQLPARLADDSRIRLVDLAGAAQADLVVQLVGHSAFRAHRLTRGEQAFGGRPLLDFTGRARGAAGGEDQGTGIGDD